jgi:Kef-type K+ transport system membrane component KefB
MPLSSIILVPLMAAAAPALTAMLARVVKIPIVVFEIVLGLLAGPAVLGWVHPDDVINTLSNLGLAMLFFLAGNEIDFKTISGRPLNRASLGWLISLAVAVALAVLLAPTSIAGVYVGIALANTALGAIMPVLRDVGELRTPFGIAVTAIGAAGEFGPLVAISVFLSGRRPGVATLILLAFVLIAAGGIYLATRRPHARLHGLITATLHTSGQFAVRLVVLILALLTGLSIWLGLDMLLGAFAAGVLVRLLLSEAKPADIHAIDGKLEALGFGLLVPIFFIHTGLTFDLNELLHDTRSLVLLPIFVVLLVLIRGLSGLVAAPVGATAADRRAIVLFTATALPIIVAVTNIGIETHDLTTSTAASLVAAGMLSVLLFPLLGLAQRRRSATAPSEVVPDNVDETEVPEEA